jgi:aminopeptidase
MQTILGDDSVVTNTISSVQLRSYAQLAVRIGLNLQPGQRLLIIGPLAAGGVSLEAAPLVREIVACAYDAGAPLVETLWGDEPTLLTRFRHAPADSFTAFSRWFPDALAGHAAAGDAVLSIYANDPDQLKDEDPERISALQQTTGRHMRRFRELISKNETNWTVIAAPATGWAAKMFPDRERPAQMTALWETIATMCRLDQADPIAAWRAHLDRLTMRRDQLNRKAFAALRYRGPGTDLTLRLPRGHRWVSGQSANKAGIVFTPNLPTEEVFTIADRAGVDGTVKATKPLSYGGTLIEDFSLRFANGRVVEAAARRGESVLRRLLDTDDGAGRLGEVALVPHNSPIARSGLLFYNTLFDENAASHVALGSAYRFTIDGGEAMTDEAFEAAGGNRSAVHVDFMIGSASLDIDGVRADGGTEPVMRAGDWALVD